MASWLTRAADRITPWDRKGERERRDAEARRKREEQQQLAPGPSAPRTPNIRTQQPVNQFQSGLSVDFGKLNVSPSRLPDNSSARASLAEAGVQKPKQSFWNKVRDTFDANTEADQYRRAVDDTRKLTDQFTSQGLDEQKARQTAVKVAKSNMRDKVETNADIIRRAPLNMAKEIATSIGRGARNIVVNPIESGRELVAQATGNKRAEAAAKYRKNKAFYGKEAADRLAAGGKLGGWEAAGAALDTAGVLPVAKGAQIAAQGVKESIASKAIRPVVQKGLAGLDEAVLGVRHLFNRPKTPAAPKKSAAPALDPKDPFYNLKKAGWRVDMEQGAFYKPDGSEATLGEAQTANQNLRGEGFLSEYEAATQRGDKKTMERIAAEHPGDARVQVHQPENAPMLTPEQIKELITTKIPVKQGVNIVDDGAPAFVNVKKVTPPTGKVIREVGGDAAKPTTKEEIAAQQAQRQREQAIADAKGARPDRRQQGVTQRDANAPDTITTKQIEYERAQLDEALANGEINKTQHKAANKALDELKPVDGKPQGTPIKVKEVEGIPVREVANARPDLPETPGKVRLTTATDPLATKSAQAAAATPPAPPAKAPVAATVADTGALTPPAMPVVQGLPTIPGDENTQQFLTRLAPNIQENVQRAARALKDLKKTRSVDRAGRAAEAARARDAILDSGGTPEEALDAFYSKLGGEYAKIDFTGTAPAREDQDRLLAMVREHYADMPFQQNNVQRAFLNLFQTGTDGYKFHVIPSDIKKIRQFLNQAVPEANLGDGAEVALRELANDAGDGISSFDKLIGFQRAILFSADASATLRQALPSSLAHPQIAARAIKDAFARMFNPAKYDARVKELASDRTAQYLQERMRMGLAMLEDGGIKGDDLYRNEGWVKKVPGVRQVVEASERHYKSLLTDLRYSIGKQFIDQNGGIAAIEKAAADTGNPDKWLQTYGEAINTLTGRGGKRGGFTERNLDGLVRFLISPRNLASKLQRINPVWYARLARDNPAAAKEAAKTTAIQLAMTATILKAADMAGLYEDGKIKIGDTRYDITGGVATILQSAVEIGQYMTGNKESTPWGNAVSEFDSIIKNQLAPAVSTFYSVIGSQPSEDGGRIDRFGNKITWPGFLTDVAAPLSIGGAVEDATEGVSPGQVAANTGLNMLGIGTNTYKSSEDKQREAVDEVTQAIGALSKYIPDGEDPTKSDVIKGALDDAFYAGDWDAYYDGITKKLDDVQNDPNATRKEVMAAELAQKRAEVYRNRNVTPELADAYENTDISTALNSDTPYRQNGDYQTDADLLRLKRDLLAVDPHAKKEELANLDVQIKRSELLAQNRVPYSLLALYQGTSLSEWRKMGDPESEDYDPDTYSQLQQIDALFADNNASYAGGGLSDNKYTAKSGGSKKLVTSFGTLGTGGLPRVRAYERVSLDTPDIPVIRRVRPNIVHRIGRG